MQIFTTVAEIRQFLQKTTNTIGFVPTMGALHKGHLSLMEASQKKCDITIVSIFVNPTQFAPNEDLTKYPRPFEEDRKLLEDAGVTALFLPNVGEIYPNAKKPKIPPLPHFTKILEGATRPTHFLGVAQVVKRLFEIIQPNEVFFGQKDFQQTLVIQWLIEKFFPQIKMNVCPIIREKDSLALSSRNRYLNAEERKIALILSKTLKLAKSLLEKGEKSVEIIEQEMRQNLVKNPAVKLDYAVIRNKTDLSEQKFANENSIALIACKIGQTRLIDNLILDK